MGFKCRRGGFVVVDIAGTEDIMRLRLDSKQTVESSLESWGNADNREG